MVVYEPFKTKPLSEFHAELAFEFPNLPDQLFDYYLIKVARDMARRGNIIRRRAIIHTQPGVTRYRLVSPDECEPLNILSLKRTTCCAPRLDIPRTFVAPDGAIPCTRSIAWYDEHEQALNVELGCNGGDIYVEMSVTPSSSPCDLPEEYYEKFLPTLTMGAKAAIMLIPGRPWTNAQLGAGLQNEYLKAVGSDAVDTMTHRMRGGIKMRFGRVL